MGSSNQPNPVAPDIRIEEIDGILELWRETLGDPNVCIAVLDGPVDLDAPCLHGSNVTEIDALGRLRSGGTPDTGHGTHIASLIFGQHSGPIKGIAPACRGILIPIYESIGTHFFCSQNDLSKALITAADVGAHIINISGGELSSGGVALPELVEAIQYCNARHCLVVAAAGNEGCERCLHVPGSLPSVLAVGAMNRQGEPLALSNWGETYRHQGLLAPGERILGCVGGSKLAAQTGTSFATPIVSGVAALLLALQIQRKQAPDPIRIRDVLLASAVGCNHHATEPCARLLAGRIDIDRAKTLVTTPSGAHEMTDGENQPEFTSNRPVLAAGDQPTSTPRENRMDPSSGSFAEMSGLTRSGGTSFEGVGSGVRHDQRSPNSPEPAKIAVHRPLQPGYVVPQDCGCKRGQQPVYVVGSRLGYDFGNTVREMSLQDAFFRGTLPAQMATLRAPENLLRHLLGWDDPNLDDPKAGTKGSFGGNIHDVESVIWVLFQEDCPVYAVRPQGPFAAAAYKELLHFFIDNLDIQLDEYGIHYDCLDGYFKCHAGVSEPLKRKNTGGEDKVAKKGSTAAVEPPHLDLTALLGEEPRRVARIALAGVCTGKQVILSNGVPVEELVPFMRGTSSWNTKRLVDLILPVVKEKEIAEEFTARLVSRLYEEVRNPGKSDEDRAKNWAVTQSFLTLRTLLDPRFKRNAFDALVGGVQYAAVNDVIVKPNACESSDMRYDVEISLFNFENALRGLMVLEQTVDVGDEVPVTTSPTRAFARR
jgi:cyanobactin maturation PatA/PatG family protease